MKDWTIRYRTMSGTYETRSVKAPNMQRAWLVVVQQEYDDNRIAAAIVWIRDDADNSYWQPVQYPPTFGSEDESQESTIW